MKVFGSLFAFGVLLIAAPIAAGAFDIVLSGMVSAVMLGFGVLLTIIAGIAFIISNLYNKTAPDEAFVRSGMGGVKAIIDGGAIVVGVIHGKVTVSLRTIRLVVERKASDALLTSDKLRADIKAEFFVRVEAETESVINAARSFGDRMKDVSSVTGVVEDKLVSALRTVASTMTLEELNSKRDKFLTAVKDIVGHELKPNGLTLESATISYLDQTDTRALNPNNVFDAQGLRTVADITQRNLTEKNELERSGEESRRERDVANKKKMLLLAQDQAEAEAKQGADIASKQAGEEQRSMEARIAKEKAVKIAIERAAQAQETAVQDRVKAVQIATQQAEQAREVAQQERNKEVQVATQNAQKALEVAEQERMAAVAAAREAAAKAEAARQAAEADAEAARQKVQTVAVKETAEREKQKRIIDAEALGQEAYVQAQKRADASAYEVGKAATARREAAEAEASAITKRAEADRAAAVAAAEGRQASEMIPVNVEKERVAVAERLVEVDKRRIAEVVTPELEAREKSGRVAQEFELGKLQINARVEIGKAASQALGSALAGAHMQLFGTPEDAGKMMENLSRGMGLGRLAQGVMDTLPENLRTLSDFMTKYGSACLGMLEAFAGKQGAQTPDADKETNVEATQ